MIKKVTLLAALTLSTPLMSIAQNEAIIGIVQDAGNSTLPFANIYIDEINEGVLTDESGNFTLPKLNPGKYTLSISLMGYKTEKYHLTIDENTPKQLKLTLSNRGAQLSDVEVFGVREKQPEKLDALTRLPLKPSEQIQSISVISDRVIEAQGSLTISDVTRNVPGVYTFATYGNQRESMSMRGFRGVPLLKNGVRVHSDFRGTGILTDMEGIESIQVLKGTAAITQGIATDIGSPGGTINLVTKTPKFVNGGNVGLRLGTFNQFRPTFDVQSVLDKNQTLAFRINGAYENSGSYRPGVGLEKIYINPSLAWRPDEKTEVVLEMDYMNDSRTPDPGTINMAGNDSNAIYAIPYDYFAGFTSNKSITIGTSVTARLNRQISKNVYLRAAYFGNNLNVDAVTTSFATGSKKATDLPELSPNQRYRTIGGSSRLDKNNVMQIDLVGKDIKTGSIKHTFMVGADYRRVHLSTGGSSLNALTYVDVIDFYKPIANQLPSQGYVFVPEVRDAEGNITQEATTKSAALTLKPNAAVVSSQTAFGVLAQDVITFNKYVKAFLGVRYSSQTSKSAEAANSYTSGFAWNPQFGLMVSPIKNINLFGSYTTSTDIRSAANIDSLGNPLGSSNINQFEAGFKSDWIDNRLRFNFTYYKINNRNMSLAVYDENWNPTGYYTKGGNDQRQGIEVEVLGRPTRNLEIIAGYAYIDAQYKEHVAYYPGSAPLNTPKHTANGWISYFFDKGAIKGLSISAGAYYIGERPINDWSLTVTHDGIVPGQKPFMIDAYTTINAQVGYQYKNYGVRLFANNIFDQIGYNAYRTSFINQTDPRNFAVAFSYRF